MRDRYDATFSGKKSRKVTQGEIDDHVVEAHGPKSTPRRTSDYPGKPSIIDVGESHSDFSHIDYDDDFEAPPPAPPISTRFADIVKTAYSTSN